jgi:hypothetical protein
MSALVSPGFIRVRVGVDVLQHLFLLALTCACGTIKVHVLECVSYAVEQAKAHMAIWLTTLFLPRQ